MASVNELNEANKPSFCYGCSQVLHNYSMLICAECLDNECEKFANLALTPSDVGDLQSEVND